MSDPIELAIDALGGQGDGIGRAADGSPVFVAGALPGERVRAAIEGTVGGGRRARLVDVLEPAAGRVSAVCRHFLDCGGCAAQHMGAHVYEDWKRGMVADALSRAGVAANVGPLHRVPGASRRRARLFAARARDRAVIGFQAQGSHRIVDMAECPALVPRLFTLTGSLREFFGRELAPSARGEAEAQEVDGALDVVIRLPGALDRGLRERLARFAGEAGIARIGWQRLAKGRRAALEAPETIAELAPVRALFGGVTVPLPPLAFLQASTEGERALVAAVTARVADGARVADLYAGAGTFTFPLAAKGCTVAAFDGAEELIAALGGAARTAGLGARVTGQVRDLERRPVMAAELDRFDACVFDPPRGGAAAQAREVAASDIASVVAVSCNPVSFARDARTLVDAGFEIGPVMPVDQFVWTRHLEVVAAFSRA